MRICIGKTLAGVIFLSLLPLKNASAYEFRDAAQALQTLVALLPTEFIQEWGSDYFSSQDRAKRLELSTNFPRFFGIRFACQFQPVSSSPITLIPGDWLESESGGLLVCPDGVNARVHAKSKLQLQQLGGVPVIFLQYGFYQLDLGAAPFVMRSKRMLLSFEGKGAKHQMEALASESGEKFRCNRGNVFGKLMAIENSAQLVLESFLCRMEIQQEGRGVQYLHGFERVRVPDLRLVRAAFPANTDLDAPEGMGNYGFSLTAKTDPGSGAYRLDWNLLAPADPSLSCHLYAQKAEHAVAEEVRNFKAEKMSGEISVPKELYEAYLSLVCEGETGVFASQVVNIKAVPAN